MTYTEISELITALTPLSQTVIIIGTIITVGLCFREKILGLVDTIIKRIKAGGRFKAWGLEFDELKKLERANPQPNEPNKIHANFADVEKLNSFRYGYYEKNRNLFLVHVIEPSRHNGQQYDIFIYLFRHKTADLSDVKQADFFLGPYWANQIFTRKVSNGKIGLSTSAYGSFLCICKITFTDGTEVILDRYIDFEMGKHLHC